MAKTDTDRASAATDDLYRVRAKAELVGGRLQLMEPAGDSHGAASLAIASNLRAHTKRTATGVACADSVGFLVDLHHRRSFSPDAAFHRLGDLWSLGDAADPRLAAITIRHLPQHRPGWRSSALTANRRLRCRGRMARVSH